MEQIRVGFMGFASLATDNLPGARYNKRMLNFLCQQMTQAAIAFQNVPEDAPQNVVGILKEAMKDGSTLVKSHAKKFNIRTFYKVDHIAHRVEELCNTFSECFIDLGLQIGSTSELNSMLIVLRWTEGTWIGTLPVCCKVTQWIENFQAWRTRSC